MKLYMLFTSCMHAFDFLFQGGTDYNMSNLGLLYNFMCQYARGILNQMNIIALLSKIIAIENNSKK